jgi:hypothetical protein
VSAISRMLKRSTLPVLLVLCLAAVSASYAFADEAPRPLATTVIGDPDAAVTGKFAVGTATPGNKALTVVGVIDFLGSGTVHNYFTEGGGNNMQINTNVDEANAIGDTSKSQWKLVMGSSLDWFSIRRSPAGGTYNEDALLFIQGSTGNVGIATVDTNNAAAIPFTPQAKLDVETASGNGVWGVTSGNSPASNLDTGVTGWATATSGITVGAGGESDSTSGRGVMGYAPATSGTNYGVYGLSLSPDGRGVYGRAYAHSGQAMGVLGVSWAPEGYGVAGDAEASTGVNYGVWGETESTSGFGVWGGASTTTGTNYGVYGWTNSTDGYAGYFDGNVTVDGDLNVAGVAAGFFPRPSYDSGYYTATPPWTHAFTHSLGGDIDSYLVDLSCKTLGGTYRDPEYAQWYDLNTDSITVQVSDPECWHARVRIWVIN